MTKRQRFELLGDWMGECIVDPVHQTRVLGSGFDVDIGFGAVGAVCEFQGDVRGFGVLLGGLGIEGDGVGDPDAVVL